MERSTPKKTIPVEDDAASTASSSSSSSSSSSLNEIYPVNQQPDTLNQRRTHNVDAAVFSTRESETTHREETKSASTGRWTHGYSAFRMNVLPMSGSSSGRLALRSPHPFRRLQRMTFVRRGPLGDTIGRDF
eukprot:CAMPEP_0114501400 /NCGR_PEP_ID=MMETSP0109-20121206/8476_1 /TAXON_ID=29199 /ORGANISM="Chlorarachnion reptans, Strain CCCM449" /LENGTH=131 /DNA_ID=CAMNT_0001679123 /DNA_START=55 /DNA_END=450 /DNA_ORIENTATION=+